MSNDSPRAASHGRLFIVSAPSGGGKTSLLSTVVAQSTRLKVSISHTTRQRRASEVDGTDYYFVDEQTFRNMIERDGFVEYARVFEEYYGTSKSFLTRTLERGSDVVLAIDWQGARQVRTQYPDALSVFILPPSLQVLQQRLAKRGLDSDAAIQLRMAQASAEMSHFKEYDCVIVNDDFEQAVATLQGIFTGTLDCTKAAVRQHAQQVAVSLGLSTREAD